MKDLSTIRHFLIALNGAWILTIGVWAAESTGYKKTAKFFKVVGSLFLVIGVLLLIFE